MKKISFLIICLTSFVTSCQEFPLQDVNKNSIEDMNLITREILDFSSSNLGDYLSKGQNGELWYDQKLLARNSFNHLNNNFLDFSKLDLNLLVYPFERVDLLNKEFNSRVLNEDYGTFNLAQLVFADQLIGNLLAVYDLSEVGRIVRNFNIQITNSTLIQSEKDELFLLGSSALSVANFLMDGGLEIINQEMVVEFGEPTNPTIGGRIQSCPVSASSMFVSAVYGLTVGAVGGAYAGATAGTVASPIGTVTGAVSGAVVGGAAGFVSGAIGSVVTQLWETCWS